MDTFGTGLEWKGRWWARAACGIGRRRRLVFNPGLRSSCVVSSNSKICERCTRSNSISAGSSALMYFDWRLMSAIATADIDFGSLFSQ